jgi:hypothetical protein
LGFGIDNRRVPAGVGMYCGMQESPLIIGRREGLPELPRLPKLETEKF